MNTEKRVAEVQKLIQPMGADMRLKYGICAIGGRGGRNLVKLAHDHESSTVNADDIDDLSDDTAADNPHNVFLQEIREYGDAGHSIRKRRPGVDYVFLTPPENEMLWLYNGNDNVAADGGNDDEEEGEEGEEEEGQEEQDDEDAASNSDESSYSASSGSDEDDDESGDESSQVANDESGVHASIHRTSPGHEVAAHDDESYNPYDAD